MREDPARTGRRLLGCVVLVALATWISAPGQATGQGKDDVKKDDKKKEPEKRWPITFSERPWAKVFEWLTEISGKPVITVHKPTGSFSFNGPKGREYTLG